MNLKPRGFRCGSTKWKSESAIPYLKKVASGLDSADVLCVLISKNALASKWVMREYQVFLHKSMKDDRPIIPCRLDASDMPTLISDIKYADFSGGFASGMSALLVRW